MQGESAEEPIPVVSPREERTLRTANSVQDFRHRLGNQANSGASNNAPSQHSPSPVRPANPPSLSERSLSQPQLNASIKSLPQIPPRDSKRLTDSTQTLVPVPSPAPTPTTGNALTNSTSNLSTQQGQQQGSKDEPSLGLQKRTSDQTLHRKISIGTHVHPQSAQQPNQQPGEKERQSGERPAQSNAQSSQSVSNQGQGQQGNSTPSGLSGAPNNTGGNTGGNTGSSIGNPNPNGPQGVVRVVKQGGTQPTMVRPSPNANPNIQRTGEGGTGLERGSVRQPVQFGGTRVVPTQLQNQGGANPSGGPTANVQVVRVSRVQPGGEQRLLPGGFPSPSMRVVTNQGQNPNSSPSSPNPGSVSSSGTAPMNPFQNRSQPQSPTANYVPPQSALSNSAPSSSSQASSSPNPSVVPTPQQQPAIQSQAEREVQLAEEPIAQAHVPDADEESHLAGLMQDQNKPRAVPDEQAQVDFSGDQLPLPSDPESEKEVPQATSLSDFDASVANLQASDANFDFDPREDAFDASRGLNRDALPPVPSSPMELPPLHMLNDSSGTQEGEKKSNRTIISPRKKRYNSKGLAAMEKEKLVLRELQAPEPARLEYAASKSSLGPPADEVDEYYESAQITRFQFICTSKAAEKVMSGLNLGFATVTPIFISSKDVSYPIECAFNIRSCVLSLEANSAVIILVKAQSTPVLAYLLDRLLYLHEFKNPVMIVSYENEFDINASIKNCLLITRFKEYNNANLGVLVVQQTNIYSGRYIGNLSLLGYIRNKKIVMLYSELPPIDKVPVEVTLELFREVRILSLYGFGQTEEFLNEAAKQYDGLFLIDRERQALRMVQLPKIATVLTIGDLSVEERVECDQRGLVLDGFDALGPVQAKLELILRIASLRI